MATTKRARSSGKQQPGDSESVPDKRRTATASTSVAGRRKGPGAVPQEHGPAAEALPDLLPPPPTRAVPTPRNHPADDPGVWEAAILRALEGEYYKRAEWNWRINAWTIPSERDPTISYIIRRRRGIKGRTAFWWDAFKCSCTAGERGFEVCKHKAAVYIRRGDLYDDLWDQWQRR